ncbi:LLM class F420-dependent oxidoreductase [Nocardia nova]|uniref:LLM class F420-dependent oxidoreductase n=1 Tax=Nocardia nova TaxID=37330 RepID=UPI001FD4D884|nr:LLM class F420-dependent oxidoreductase [Nocardia nova]
MYSLADSRYSHCPANNFEREIYVKIGIALTDFSWPVPNGEIGSAVTELAQTADTSGIDSLWVMDHFFQIGISGHPPESPMLEAYAALGFLAGITDRIRLGTLVTAVPYRHPGVLIKSATTLDVLSGGRLIFGVGAGAPFDPEPMGPSTTFEAEGLGIPFPRLPRRFEQLEELLQIAHRMWSEDETPYRGEHYELARPLNSPNSIQRPHPPILIGGSGERKTLPLVARYADACNLFDLPGSGYADNLAHKLAVLRRQCDEIGRDYSTIEKTVTTALDIDSGPGPVLDHLKTLAATGIDHAILGPDGPWTPPRLRRLIEMAPEIHAL